MEEDQNIGLDRVFEAPIGPRWTLQLISHLPLFFLIELAISSTTSFLFLHVIIYLFIFTYTSAIKISSSQNLINLLKVELLAYINSIYIYVCLFLCFVMKAYAFLYDNYYYFFIFEYDVQLVITIVSSVHGAKIAGCHV